MTTPIQAADAEAFDVGGIPDEVLAVVDAKHPEGHPSRAGVLRDLAAFYGSGGFRADRVDRVTPIVHATEAAA